MRLEYEGRFLADIKEFGIFQSSTSQAVAVDVFFSTLAYFDGDSQRPYDGYETRGRFFVIGKTGDVLPEQTSALADATGWDGDLAVILHQTWQPVSPVQIIVKPETNDKGRTYYNAIRILRADWEPSGAGNVSEEDGRQIAARYSSALKSLVKKYRRQQAEEQGEGIGEETSSSGTETADPAADPEPEASWDEAKAWKVFQEKAEGMSEADVESVWNEAVLHYGDGKAIDELTAEEWGMVAAIDPKSWTPF